MGVLMTYNKENIRMVNWDDYRKLFPVVNNRTYFMTAGAGAIPGPVLNAIVGQYEEVSKRGGAVFGENLAIVEECRKKLARLINADKEDIAFIPSVSYGMNALAHSMKKNEIFFTLANEFPSTLLPIKNSGRLIKEISQDGDRQSNLIKFLEQTQSDNSSLVVSMVSYMDGYRLDLNEIAKFKKFSRLLINGTQAIGAFPIDVKEQKIDALICSCYKWMCCGEGLSFLYIHPDFFKELKPALVGWRSTQHSMSFSKDEPLFFDDARVFELGWDNMTIFSGFREALTMIESIGINNIAQRINYLSSEMMKRLSELNIPIITKPDPEHLSGIILIGPFEDIGEIVSSLEENNIWVNPRRNAIRVSLHFYNNEEDINKLSNSLEKILKLNHIKHARVVL